jgi:hypothetical protein
MSDLIDFALREGYPNLFEHIKAMVDHGSNGVDVELAVALLGYGDLICTAARHEAELLIKQRDDAASQQSSVDGGDPCQTCALSDCLGTRCTNTLGR